MKAVIIALAVVGLAAAQNVTLIPTNITSSCSSFLSTFNNDTTLASCVQPLINTTASFSPTSGSNLSTSDINYTLASLCKTTSGCSDSTIRSWLSQFYGACSTELTGSTGYNAQVRELYDILYVINPLKAAVCSIDSANQDYCVNDIVSSYKNSTTKSSNSTASSNGTASSNTTASGNNTVLIANLAAVDPKSPVSIAADYLYITIHSASSITKRLLNLAVRQDASGAQQSTFATVITPNTTTYRNTNLPFLFLQPSMSNNQLCTPCTRSIMVSYIKWESTVPYALGLSASPILGGQMNLWNAINGTCGNAFTQAIMSEVGVYTAVTGSFSGASAVIQGGVAATAVAGMAFVAGAMAFLA